MDEICGISIASENSYLFSLAEVSNHRYWLVIC